jgi:hypothetical protein
MLRVADLHGKHSRPDMKTLRHATFIIGKVCVGSGRWPVKARTAKLQDVGNCMAHREGQGWLQALYCIFFWCPRPCDNGTVAVSGQKGLIFVQRR